MTTESIQVSAELPVDVKRLFDAWLSSEQHTLMTGGKAVIDPKVGGKFSAWDGYITGETIKIEPGKRVIQKWRTSEFPKESADSKLEVVFTAGKNGLARLTFKHSEIPAGQGVKYQGGWEQFYFVPMKAFFAPPKKAAPAKKEPAKKEPAKKEPAKKAAAKTIAKKAAKPKTAAKSAPVAQAKAAPAAAAKTAAKKSSTTAKKAEKPVAKATKKASAASKSAAPKAAAKRAPAAKKAVKTSKAAGAPKAAAKK